MSRGRTIFWLLAGLVIVVAAHLAVDVKTDAAPRGLRRNALVPACDKATAISIARADGSSVRFVREGSVWRIAAPYAARADQGMVLRIVDALAFSPISEEMTDAELLRLGRTRGDFRLDRPRLELRVDDARGKETAVAFGAMTPAGDGVYATVGENSSVYIVSSNVCAALEHDVSDFRCRRLVDIGEEDVVAFDVKGGAGRFVHLARAGNSWKLDGSAETVVSPDRVRQFVQALIGLEAQDFVWPSGGSNQTDSATVSLLAGYGLDSETALSVTFKCWDGTDRAVSFGNDAGRNCVYALAQGGRVIVTVRQSVLASVRAGASAFVDRRLFPVDADALSMISLDDGRTTYLLSRAGNGGWRLDAPTSAPADPANVKKLLDRLLSLPASDAPSEGGVRVSLGTNAAPVVVSATALFDGMRPDDLRAKEVVAVEPALVKRVVVTDRGQKPVSVVMDADRSSWVVESAEVALSVNGEAVRKLVAALGPLKALHIARIKVSDSELGAYGLDKPVRTIAIDQTGEGTVRRNVFLGDVTDGGRYATLGASDTVFVISSAGADDLLVPIVR